MPMPKKRKRGQLLTELVVNEVSLVDSPANSSTDEHGQKVAHARVALWKRDTSNDEIPVVHKENKRMAIQTLEDVCKKRNATRTEISTAVDARASIIAKRTGCGIEKAQSLVWNNADIYKSYADAPAEPVKVQREMTLITKAEARMDQLTRQVMKSDKLSYANSLRKVLDTSPELYDLYCQQMTAGDTFAVPQRPEYIGKVAEPDLEDALDDGTDEEEEDMMLCDKCSGEVMMKSRYCQNCGAKM